MESVISEIHQLWWSLFFWNSSKVNLDFKNEEKNWGKVFFVGYNLFWIDFVNLSLLRREYLSRTVNVFAKSPKILHIAVRNFFDSIVFTVINMYGKGSVVQTSTVFGPVYHIVCQRVVWNGANLDIYQTPFLGVRNFGNPSAMRDIFFKKMFNV